MVKIGGSSIALQFRRTRPIALDATDIFKTHADALEYANNAQGEYMPYLGQIISVTEDPEESNNNIYQLKAYDPNTQPMSWKNVDANGNEVKHYRLTKIVSHDEGSSDYLSRTENQEATGHPTFKNGITANGADITKLITKGSVTSEPFDKASGKGYRLLQNADGSFTLEIANVDVSGKMIVETLEIKKSHSVSGSQWTTYASLTVDRLIGKNTVAFLAEKDGVEITNDFVKGDFAYFTTYNILGGKREYWETVSAVSAQPVTIDGKKYHTITLTGTPNIQVGDTIIQLGNATDTSRQGATCVDVGGIAIYRGINNNTELPRPYANLSPSDTWIDASTIVFSTETKANSLTEVIGSLRANIQAIKEQSDKQVTFWYGDSYPNIEAEPSVNWTTEALREEHAEDIYYFRPQDDGTGGRAYRWHKDSVNGWEWTEITDKDTIGALNIAEQASENADSKARGFVTTPTDADVYDKGDIWANATGTFRRSNGSSVTYNNEVLICKTGKAKGAKFSIDHWQEISFATRAFMQTFEASLLQTVANNFDSRDEQIKAATNEAKKAQSDAVTAKNLATAYMQNQTQTNTIFTQRLSAIQSTADDITAVVGGIVKDADGNVTGVTDSKLVVEADFASLLTGKAKYDPKTGRITNSGTAGLVTTESAASLIAQKIVNNQQVAKAVMGVAYDGNETDGYRSKAVITADDIKFTAQTSTFEGAVQFGQFFRYDPDKKLLSLYDIEGNNFTFKSGTIEGDVTIKGKLSGATGTFSGDLNAAGGTFTGVLSGAGGSFRGDITASMLRLKKSDEGTLNGSIIRGSYVPTIMPKLAQGETVSIRIFAPVITRNSPPAILQAAEGVTLFFQVKTEEEKREYNAVTVGQFLPSKSGKVEAVGLGEIIGVGDSRGTQWYVIENGFLGMETM